MTAAADRKGGKFANMSAAADRKGGKFATMAAVRAGGGKFANKNANPPPDQTAVKKPKVNRIRVERQAALFKDLDEAERLTMDILELASSTALCLSDAATVTDVDASCILSDNKSTLGKSDEEGKDGTSEAPSKSVLSTLLSKCDSNGEEYLKKVRKIHSLISPHSNLVVAYRNHAVDVDALEGTTNDNAQAPSANNNNVDKKDSGNEKKRKREDEVVSSETIKDGDNSKSSSRLKNMYAARVEFKLAVERKEVIREMLRLEKENLNMEESN